MRSSEISDKYTQFVKVNEILLHFVIRQEGPDEDLEECLTLYSGLSLSTPEQLEYILTAKMRTFHPRHRRGLTRARSRSRSRTQSESRTSSILSESTSSLLTPEEIAR